MIMPCTEKELLDECEDLVPKVIKRMVVEMHKRGFVADNRDDDQTAVAIADDITDLLCKYFSKESEDEGSEEMEETVEGLVHE